MARRYELTQEQFRLIEELLPPGRRWNDHHVTLNGIFWWLYSGAQWREVPERYGKWKSLYERFNFWRADGTLDRLLERLHLALNAEGRLDHGLWSVDATCVRVSRSAAGGRKKIRPQAEPDDHVLGRSRGGFGTKIHLVVDGAGVPLAATVSAGQAHESKQMAAVLESVCLPSKRGRPRRRPRRLAGDKGYSYPGIRAYLRRRGIRAVIPTRKDQRANPRFDRATYRRRNVVERCVGWLKENRRLATRYEKLAVNYLAVVKLAMIRRCFQLLELSDRTSSHGVVTAFAVLPTLPLTVGREAAFWKL